MQHILPEHRYPMHVADSMMAQPAAAALEHSRYIPAGEKNFDLEAKEDDVVLDFTRPTGRLIARGGWVRQDWRPERGGSVGGLRDTETRGGGLRLSEGDR